MVKNKVTIQNTVTGAVFTRIIEEGKIALYVEQFKSWKVMKVEFYGYS